MSIFVRTYVDSTRERGKVSMLGLSLFFAHYRWLGLEIEMYEIFHTQILLTAQHPRTPVMQVQVAWWTGFVYECSIDFDP